MTQYDYRVGSSNLGQSYGGVHGVFVQERYLDFLQIAQARAAAGLAALVATDTLLLVGIPADSFVIAVTAKVVKVEGAAFTFDLGDSGSATQYQSNTNGNATGTTASAATTWKAYNAADNLVMNLDNNNVDLAQIVVKVIMARLGQVTGAAYGGLQN